MKEMLFADSGGTKTDWCFVDANGMKSYFSTESYHPANWNDTFFDRISSFWKSKTQMKSAQLYFYGAGCFNVDNARKLSDKFKEFHFANVKVRSDLHGAGMASYGMRKGLVAIMGTGSVLFSWKDIEVGNVIGGLGHNVGDQGSGYYFGRLVLEAIRHKTLSLNQLKIVGSKFKDVDLDQKFAVANITSELRDYKDEFKNIHELNVYAFIKEHIPESYGAKLTVVGSYGYHHQNIISPCLQEKGVFVDQFIERPIEAIVEQTVSLNE